METIKIFSPATIANISCGFDVMGLCLESIGDEMMLRKVPTKGVKILSIEGADLPLETEKNVAGVAALALLNHLKSDQGFEMTIKKNIRIGSGIGSSSASAAGAVFAVNELLGRPLTNKELIPFAMEGEKLATGTAHADNVAPALLGGITLVRSYRPLDCINIHVPKELYATIIHPHIEVKTADARSVLKANVSLQKAISQWGNVGGLISGLYEEDYDLISRSLVDDIIEPLRSVLIPGFYELKEAATKAGALGSGISGSGPSVFALSRGQEQAKIVAKAFADAYQKYHIPFETYVSPVNTKGVQII